MKHSKHRHNFLIVTIMALLLAVIIPATASAQGRGRGHGRGGIFGSSHNKCGKFVNCHDARNGRLDGRGPRGTRVGNILMRNRIRHRNRRFDNDDFIIRNERLNRNRKLDNDFLRERGFRDRNLDNDRDLFRNGNGRGRHRGH